MSEVKKLVGFLFENNYLVTPDLLKSVPSDFYFDDFYQRVGKDLVPQKVKVVFDKSLLFDKEVLNIKTKLKVVENYDKEPCKVEVKDFVTYYKNRYTQLKNILLQRPELQDCVSINRALRKNPDEPASIIGFIYDISVTKSGHVMLELEDPTGKIKVLLSNKNKDLMELGKELIHDEVIGISGNCGKEIVFARELYMPDITLQEYKKCKDDVNVVFAADMHIGSDLFLPEDFGRFIDWLNCDYGTEEQRAMAKKVKYLFFAGDLVDGVGIYPGQDAELVIKDIVEQYDLCYDFISKIRKDIKIVICGGNHDALRLSEPQPCLNRDFAKKLYSLPNVYMVTNPSLINIHAIEGFAGFDILLYHGMSFDYYVNNVDFLRNNGGYDRADLMMEFLLKKRHLGPTHIAGLTMPDTEYDPLVIEKIPDFFVTGHVHHDVVISNYKNVCLIGCSSFQNMSGFQEKMGHENIVPSKIPVVNLKTRKINVLDFSETN
tara:strand:- start:41 stop:1507 length:1467 start_codon:yes stop_codon:yes gene_type:complete